MGKAIRISGFCVLTGKPTKPKKSRIPKAALLLDEFLKIHNIWDLQNLVFRNVDLSTKNNKSFVEMIKLPTKELKLPGMYVVKSGNNLLAIKEIKSVFKALDSWINRRKCKEGKIVKIAAIPIPGELQAGASHVIERWTKDYLKSPLNKKDHNYLKKMFAEQKMVELRKLTFVDAFTERNGKRIFSLQEFGSRPGLYFIKHQRKLQYIGMAKNLPDRCPRHFRKKFSDRPRSSHVYFDPTLGPYKVCFVDFPYPDKDQAEYTAYIFSLEKWLVETLNPLLNTEWNNGLGHSGLTITEPYSASDPMPPEKDEDGRDGTKDDYPF